MKKQKLESIQKIALERMEILFEQAEKEFRNGRKDLSNRYVELARRIGMRARVPLPSHLKKKFCRNCHSFWVPGKNVRVRTRPKQHYLLYTCGVCGSEFRHPYVKEMKAKRARKAKE